MGTSQKEIYYISGEDPRQFVMSPFLEHAVSQKYDVLFMTDPVDEYIIHHISPYGGFPLVNCCSENFKAPEVEEDKKTQFAELSDEFKEILKDQVDKVVVSYKSSHSPCVVSSASFGVSPYMEKIIKSQTMNKNNPNMFAKSKVLEINPKSPII